MSDPLSQAEILKDRHRYEEAVALLHQHLAREPEDAEAHALLAQTRLEMPGETRAALESIDNAIAIEADEAFYFGVKALTLSKLDQDRKALESAEEAIRLDPDAIIGWIAKGQALGGLNRWPEAEAAARTALELDPDNQHAQNALLGFLRMQGRIEESQEGVDRRLERDPEDPDAHANAGWADLHSGKRREAEEHFREALRLDPGSEFARVGLREAYKARSPLYRGFLAWAFFMQRHTEGKQWIFVIGLYLAYKFGRAVLESIHPVAAGILTALYLLFCFWSFIASGTGHAIMLLDRWARLTLNPREQIDGVVVGWFFLVGIALSLLALTVLPTAWAYLGGAMAIGAIPLSRVTLNKSLPGQIVFGTIAALVFAAGGVGFVVSLSGGNPFSSPTGGFMLLAILGAIASTWLANISALQSDAEE